ncbi:hypothetical protein LTR87_015699 [Friedmanniomyces endolithicus]|nr:hypothetical protein LTR87_015699 [Friedmanniomyces endolithicus]
MLASICTSHTPALLVAHLIARFMHQPYLGTVSNLRHHISNQFIFAFSSPFRRRHIISGQDALRVAIPARRLHETLYHVYGGSRAARVSSKHVAALVYYEDPASDALAGFETNSGNEGPAWIAQKWVWKLLLSLEGVGAFG